MRRIPAGLEAPGRRLWRDASTVKPRMSPGDALLLEKACRIADHLARVEEVIDGEPFVEYVVDGERYDGAVFTLNVNGALSEHRLQTNTLRACLTSLGLLTTNVNATPVERGGDPGDQLGERRRARRAANSPGL